MSHNKKDFSKRRSINEFAVGFSFDDDTEEHDNTKYWRTLNLDQSVQHECSETCTTPLITSARTSNPSDMELVLETLGNAEKVNDRDCLGRTALHWAVSVGCNCDDCTTNAVRCVKLLVEYSRSNINAQDNQGLTPLHLAAENQATRCAAILLEKGADVSIKAKDGTKALILIVEKIPEAMENLLDKAVSMYKYESSNIKCEIELNFGAVVGYSETRGPEKGIKISKPKKEMLLLNLILDASSASRKKILTHPLIAIFLYLKWRKVQTVFWATILFNVLLLLLYTLYILDIYIVSCPYRPKLTEPAHVKAAKTLGVLTADNHTMDFIKFSWFQFTPKVSEVTERMKEDGCHLEIGLTVKSVLLLGLTLFMVINEVFKMLPAPRAYAKRTMNRAQWALFFFILLTSWPVFMSAPNISFWQYQAAAFGLFLAWALMLSQIGKFPKLGLYVDILGHVLKNFGFFMLTYASLVIAFALSFCVLFPGNAPYSSIPLAVLKVLMMMVGEVNYEELFYGKEEDPVDDLLYPLTGHILYGAFVIMITIVLMNLLVGLTVSDIQGLKINAELTRVSRQIAEISQLESFVFSRRVQSFFPGRLGSFIRKSILVVKPAKPQEDYLDQSYRFEQRNFVDDPRDNFVYRLRPNDPNDNSNIPLELKQAVLRRASTRHRFNRYNRCPKKVNKFKLSPKTLPFNPQQLSPMIEEKPQLNAELLTQLESRVMDKVTEKMDKLMENLDERLERHMNYYKLLLETHLQNSQQMQSEGHSTTRTRPAPMQTAI